MNERPPGVPGVDMQRLRPFILDAIKAQDAYETALALARKFDAGEWRLIADWPVVGDELDQVELTALRFRVEVRDDLDTWIPLLRIHWSNLGLEWADIEMAWKDTLRQHREGSQPGGPNDPGRSPHYWRP